MKPDKPDDDSPSDLDRALKELLVGEVRVKVDPTTGQVIPPDSEKSPLTDSPDAHTLP